MEMKMNLYLYQKTLYPRNRAKNRDNVYDSLRNDVPDNNKDFYIKYNEGSLKVALKKECNNEA